MSVVDTLMWKMYFYRNKELFPAILASRLVSWEEGSLKLLNNSVLPRATIIQKQNNKSQTEN